MNVVVWIVNGTGVNVNEKTDECWVTSQDRVLEANVDTTLRSKGIS